jgi:hypothetical protein
MPRPATSGRRPHRRLWVSMLLLCNKCASKWPAIWGPVSQEEAHDVREMEFECPHCGGCEARVCPRDSVGP